MYLRLLEISKLMVQISFVFLRSLASVVLSVWDKCRLDKNLFHWVTSGKVFSTGKNHFVRAFTVERKCGWPAREGDPAVPKL